MTANARRHESNVAPADSGLAAPLLAVFTQIAALDRAGAMARPIPHCRDCRFRNGWDARYAKPRYPHCDKGYMPLSFDDGCAEWAPRGKLPV